MKQREELVAILNRNFGDGQENRFDWRHVNNPAGEAWAWLGVNDNGDTVATVAVFPRLMLVNDRQVLCGQVGGFAVDAAHRSLGPAVLLQRTTFEPVDSGYFSFCYDCPPHEQGMSTFLRLGMRPNCEIFRYARLLRSDQFLQDRMGKGLHTKPIVAAANLLLRRRSSYRTIPGLEITQFTGTFGEEFTHLDRAVSSSGALRASRSAELLNWRYRQNPGADSLIWVARKQGELIAFLALWIKENRAYVVDLFGHSEEVGHALLNTAVESCMGNGLHSVYGYSSPDHTLRRIFENSGFRQRELAARVVAYQNAGTSPPVLTDGLRWAFGHAEEMV